MIQRDGIMHGLGGWFSAQLSPSASMTNSPVAENPIQRSQLFFPLANPIEVLEGDIINVTICDLPATEIIRWQVEIFDGKTEICKGKFNQNSWKGMLLSREDLHKTLPIAKPELSPTGQARLTVLSLCDGKNTLSEIQNQIYQRHANLFHTPGRRCQFCLGHHPEAYLNKGLHEKPARSKGVSHFAKLPPYSVRASAF